MNQMSLNSHITQRSLDLFIDNRSAIDGLESPRILNVELLPEPFFSIATEHANAQKRQKRIEKRNQHSSGNAASKIAADSNVRN